MHVKVWKKEVVKNFLKFVYQFILYFWRDYDFPSIRPLPCTSKVTGEIGTCMYNWSCRHVVHGIQIGTCVDRFLVGSCCKIPSFSSTNTTSTQWYGNPSHHATKSPQPETWATAIQILTLANKHFVRKPVSPVRQKVTVESFLHGLKATTKSPLIRNESVLSTPKSSHVSGTHLVEVIPLEKFDRPAYLSTLSLSDVSNISTNSSASSLIKDSTPSPQDYSSSLITNLTEEDSHSLPANDEGKFTVSVDSNRWTEPAYPWPSITPSTLTNSDRNGSYLDGLDATQVCGRSRINPVGRIVGGRRSQYLRWPWMISLRRYEGRTFRHKCGATLLNHLWAVTAAHCVDGKMPNELLLRLGEYNFHQANESLPHVERRVYLMVIHPKFDAVTYENDLALLRFYEPVKFRANILPVCLPQVNDDVAGRTAVVTGWGRLAEEGELPGLLHEVHMPILTNKECEEMYSDAGYVESIPDVFVCAGLSHGGLDACEGDSGGPMVVRSNSGPWALAGLISWGMGCAAPNQPGVYTRITKFVDWIQEIISF